MARASESNVAVEQIQYQAGSVTGNGALVWNEKVSGKRPLLLVMPNWLGVTEIAIKRAGEMAGDKYIAFVADMYGGGKTCAGPPESQDLDDGGARRSRGGAQAHRRPRSTPWSPKPTSAASATPSARPRSASASAAAMCSNWRAPAPT